MSYILHAETNQRFEIEGKTREEMQAEIRAAGLAIGNVTISRMLEGKIQSANGFEIIESLSEEEQAEIDTARELIIAKDATVQDVIVTPAPEVANAVVDTEPAAELLDPAAVEAAELRAAEVRRRILGENISTALDEVAKPTDDAALASATATLKSLTPQAVTTEDRKRRHNKRDDMINLARASDFGQMISVLEADLSEGNILTYVNPDMRWFQFTLKSFAADQANIFNRTNVYIDVAPIVVGGWGWSMYVDGKSATKRTKTKTTDLQALVGEINAWLPGVILELGLTPAPVVADAPVVEEAPVDTPASPVDEVAQEAI